VTTSSTHSKIRDVISLPNGVVAGSRDSEDVAAVWSCLVVSVDRSSSFVLFCNPFHPSWLLFCVSGSSHTAPDAVSCGDGGAIRHLALPDLHYIRAHQSNRNQNREPRPADPARFRTSEPIRVPYNREPRTAGFTLPVPPVLEPHLRKTARTTQQIPLEHSHPPCRSIQSRSATSGSNRWS
jgi:hypothetical protein